MWLIKWLSHGELKEKTSKIKQETDDLYFNIKKNHLVPPPQKTEWVRSTKIYTNPYLVASITDSKYKKYPFNKFMCNNQHKRQR